MKTETQPETETDSKSKKFQRENIVKYSRNVFLPITNLCRNDCAYCGFKKEPENGAWIMSKEEVMTLVEKAKEAGCTEALITLGERPEEEYRMIREKLDEWGYESTVDYLADLSKGILEEGVLPHTNAGILEKDEIARLRDWNASIGLMLETVAELKAHRKSVGKTPEIRLEMIKKAGELKVPITTGILVGIGENQEDREKSLIKLREIQKEYGHIQEVIIQPFKPKKGTPMENKATPKHSKIVNTVELARNIMPNMNIQIPPNLTQGYEDFLHAGANDLGGVSTVTPDFINPEKPWPKISNLESAVKSTGFELKERLPIHPEFVKNSEFMSSEVEEVVSKISDQKGYRKVKN